MSATLKAARQADYPGDTDRADAEEFQILSGNTDHADAARKTRPKQLLTFFSANVLSCGSCADGAGYKRGVEFFFLRVAPIRKLAAAQRGEHS